MSLPAAVARRLATVGDWLTDHPVAYVLALVTAPTVAQVLVAVVTGGELREAVENGLSFGVAFATVIVALRVYGDRSA